MYFPLYFSNAFLNCTSRLYFWVGSVGREVQWGELERRLLDIDLHWQPSLPPSPLHPRCTHQCPQPRKRGLFTTPGKWATILGGQFYGFENRPEVSNPLFTISGFRFRFRHWLHRQVSHPCPDTASGTMFCIDNRQSGIALFSRHSFRSSFICRQVYLRNPIQVLANFSRRPLKADLFAHPTTLTSSVNLMKSCSFLCKLNHNLSISRVIFLCWKFNSRWKNIVKWTGSLALVFCCNLPYSFLKHGLHVSKHSGKHRL